MTRLKIMLNGHVFWILYLISVIRIVIRRSIVNTVVISKVGHVQFELFPVIFTLNFFRTWVCEVKKFSTKSLKRLWKVYSNNVAEKHSMSSIQHLELFFRLPNHLRLKWPPRWLNVTEQNIPLNQKSSFSSNARVQTLKQSTWKIISNGRKWGSMSLRFSVSFKLCALIKFYFCVILISILYFEGCNFKLKFQLIPKL